MVLPVYSQNSDDKPVRLPKIISLDKSKVECVYVYSEKKGEGCTVYDRILLSGSSFSKYFDYGNYRRDSAMLSKPNQVWTKGEYQRLNQKYDAKNPLFSVLRDRKSNNLTFKDAIVVDLYQYSDTVNIKWKICNGTMEICGYKCKKATCEFRGRKWTAWFSEKIPVSEGPWKFGGLPGLILRAEDENKEHLFYATSIRKGGSEIFERDRAFMKTTRKKFNKANKQYHDNTSSYWGNSSVAPKGANGGKAPEMLKKLPYNPLELE